MTLQDWLTLVSTGCFSSELQTIVQPRKLFRLATAFLTRVRDRLPTQSDRLALDITEKYLNGQATHFALIEGWTTAELDGGEGIWSPEDYCWCDCCEPDPEDWPFLPGTLNFARDPAWFAEHASATAARLAGGGWVLHGSWGYDGWQAEIQAQYWMYRDLVGDATAFAQPSPVSLDCFPIIRQLVSLIGAQETPDPLTLFALADAAEEAGCDDTRLLSHLRARTDHYRGCWAVERLAGREMIPLQRDKTILSPKGRYTRRR